MYNKLIMVADVNEEDLGIRTFQLRKERAVERAVEKVRHNLGPGWSELSSPDIDVFNWALGETWATMGFYDWNDIGFSFLDLDTVEKIIATGKQVLDHKKLGTEAFNEIHQILKSLEAPGS